MMKPLLQLQFTPPTCHFSLGDSLVLDSGEVLVGFSDPRSVGPGRHRPKDRTNVVELINPIQPDLVKTLRWTDEFSRCDKFLSGSDECQIFCLYGHRYNRNGLDLLLPPGLEMTKILNFRTSETLKSVEEFRSVGEYSLLPMQLVSDRLTYLRKQTIGPPNYAVWQMTQLGQLNSTQPLEQNWLEGQIDRVINAGVGLMFLRGRKFLSFQRRDTESTAQFRFLTQLDLADSVVSEILTEADPNHGYPQEISTGRFCAERFRLKSDDQLLLISGDFHIWRLDLTELSRPKWSQVGVIPRLDDPVRICSFGLSPNSNFLTMVVTRTWLEFEILIWPLQPPQLFTLAELALRRSCPLIFERDSEGNLVPPKDNLTNSPYQSFLKFCRSNLA